VLRLQAGVNKDADGGFHIRGGRSSEIAYWVNGISITDPYDNSRCLILITVAFRNSRLLAVHLMLNMVMQCRVLLIL